MPHRGFSFFRVTLMDEEQRVITVWAEDKPGVLMRVANILTAKGVNIEQLTAAPERYQPGMSKIVIVTNLEPRFRPRVLNEVKRLVNVLSAIDVTEERSFSKRIFD
jgi:acetolactate synthase I/III small subunit